MRVSVPRCFQDHPVTTALIGLSIAWSVSVLVAFGGWLAPSAPDQRNLLYLVRQSRLIQSFKVDSAQTPPEVWLKRLGPNVARERWRSSPGDIWWMVWLQDGAPLLVLQSTDTSEPSRVSALFPGMELLFADELHRKSFMSKLPAKGFASSGLERDCIDRLSGSTAVAWNPSGLSSIAGPLAFAFHSGSYGCVSLNLDRRRFVFDGLVSSRPLSSAPSSLRRPPETQTVFKTFADLSPPQNQLALHLSGSTTKLLFASLLQRRLLSDGIEKNYGLPPQLQAQWLMAPMNLEVHLRHKGPFKAWLQLTLAFQKQQASDVNKGLASISSVLESRGMRSQLIQTSTGPNAAQSSTLIWMNDQRQELGRWSLVPSNQNQFLLRFSLGGPPGLLESPLKSKPNSGLMVRFHAKQLTELGWLKSSWPIQVRQAGQGELRLQPMLGSKSDHQDTWYWLEGQLSLR